MEHDEIIAIIQAHKDNKQLQFKNDSGRYEDARPNVELNCMLKNISVDYEWRVKPEPREYTLNVFCNGVVSSEFENQLGASPTGQIKVREVIE